VRRADTAGDTIDRATQDRERRSVDLEQPLIELRGVEKVFRSGRLEYAALRGVDLVIDEGELAAIVGPSGSGKSTLLNMITGIDRPTSGTVTVAGERIDEMTEEQLAVWRGENAGIVFQFFQLIPILTALENVMLPMDFGPRSPAADRRERAIANLVRVGLQDKADHLPSELSGGEQQRVAIARALARDPQILVADEPTGNLDTDTARSVVALLAQLNDEGTTIIYVTHDADLAAEARHVVTLRDGKVDAGG
jgi:putative ABC transport system ATP-binding protein